MLSADFSFFFPVHKFCLTAPLAFCVGVSMQGKNLTSVSGICSASPGHLI